MEDQELADPIPLRAAQQISKIIDQVIDGEGPSQTVLSMADAFRREYHGQRDILTAFEWEWRRVLAALEPAEVPISTRWQVKALTRGANYEPTVRELNLRDRVTLRTMVFVLAPLFCASWILVAIHSLMRLPIGLTSFPIHFLIGLAWVIFVFSGVIHLLMFWRRPGIDLTRFRGNSLSAYRYLEYRILAIVLCALLATLLLSLFYEVDRSMIDSVIWSAFVFTGLYLVAPYAAVSIKYEGLERVPLINLNVESNILENSKAKAEFVVSWLTTYSQLLVAAIAIVGLYFGIAYEFIPKWPPLVWVVGAIVAALTRPVVSAMNRSFEPSLASVRPRNVFVLRFSFLTMAVGVVLVALWFGRISHVQMSWLYVWAGTQVLVSFIATVIVSSNLSAAIVVCGFAGFIGSALAADALVFQTPLYPNGPLLWHPLTWMFVPSVIAYVQLRKDAVEDRSGGGSKSDIDLLPGEVRILRGMGGRCVRSRLIDNLRDRGFLNPDVIVQSMIRRGVFEKGDGLEELVVSSAGFNELSLSPCCATCKRQDGVPCSPLYLDSGCCEPKHHTVDHICKRCGGRWS